jgi:hypothetical protein
MLTKEQVIEEIYNGDIHNTLQSNEKEYMSIIFSLNIEEDLLNEIKANWKSYKAVKSVDENASNIMYEKLLNSIDKMDTKLLKTDIPLSDEVVEALVSDLVGALLYYDRKSDDEISSERINSYFKNDETKISIMAEKFKMYLENYIKSNDD